MTNQNNQYFPNLSPSQLTWCLNKVFSCLYAEFSSLTDEHFVSKFYGCSKKICLIEAQSFLSEESKQELIEDYSCYHRLFDELISHTPQPYENITADGKRILAGLLCTFVEWCEETCFFSLSKEEQTWIWTENPLETAQSFFI